MTTIRNGLFLLMIFFMFAYSACGKDASPLKTDHKEETHITHKLPKLLDLGAKYCAPCRMMTPILDELSTDYQGRLEVEFIDVQQAENRQKARAHKIQVIPTQIFFDADGKELWRHEGFISKEDILNKWEELGFIFDVIQPKEEN